MPMVVLRQKEGLREVHAESVTEALVDNKDMGSGSFQERGKHGGNKYQGYTRPVWG